MYVHLTACEILYSFLRLGLLFLGTTRRTCAYCQLVYRGYLERRY